MALSALMASASCLGGKLAGHSSSLRDRRIRSDASGSSSYGSCRRYYDDRFAAVLAGTGVFLFLPLGWYVIAVGEASTRLRRRWMLWQNDSEVRYQPLLRYLSHDNPREQR